MVKGDFGYDGLARVIRYALLRTEMEARNNLLIAALEAAANGIVITDKDATVIWANSAFGRLTGYSPEEAVGNKPNKLVKSGLQDKAFYEDMWADLLVGQHWRGELINKRKNGSLYHEELSIAPVKNRAGEITHFIGIKEDITARKEMEAQLQKLASTDPLTELANRRVFLELLEQERAKVARLPHYSAALLMMDLDFFKRINDSYGHATGDTVLKVFADIARNSSRAIDVPARLGGEEFAILLSGADKNDAMVMAERLREKVAEAVIDHEAGPVNITVSIGATVLSAGDINGEAVLHRADVALYEAKDRGRNQTCWFDF
jgi:diguanylate cyclase (GGDEF)-like protein/PAS domain S-box-containing protein